MDTAQTGIHDILRRNRRHLALRYRFCIGYSHSFSRFDYVEIRVPKCQQ